MAYWLLYDILEEEGLLGEYGVPSLGDDVPYYDAPDITGNVEINTERPKFKFDEDVVLSLMKDYIGETYTKHYVSGNKFQTL